MTSPRTSMPRQSGASQVADAAFLLALLFVTLFVTTFVLADDGASGTADTAGTSIEELPISAAEKQQFTQMTELDMVDTETVAASVSANSPQDDRYSFSWLALAGTVALALGYLGFVYVASFREYREVVRARFDTPQGGSR